MLEPATKVIDGRKRKPSALSLKKIHNKLKDKDDVSLEEDYSKKPKTVFSELELVEKWKFFGEQLKKDGELNLASIVNANQPTLLEQTIVFNVPNKIMQEQFGVVKSKLINFLRVELNNYSIQIKTNVVHSEKKKYIYTKEEKFKKMVESNKHVMLLKNTFKLDI